MYEYHGWITIRETFLNEDILDDKTDEIVAEIRKKMDAIGYEHGFLDLRGVNGEYHLAVSGFENRKTALSKKIYELFLYISQKAVGSYGLLYIHDDEDPNGQENEFQVYVLSRGILEKKKDIFLSPYIPRVEEA